MAWQQTEHRDFSGGENLSDDPRFLPENQAVLIENALITGRGQVKRRPGMIRVADLPYHSNAIDFDDRIDLYRHVRWRDGSRSYFVISGRKLYLEDGTLLQDNLGPGPYGDDMMQNKFLLVDGQNYYESDGTPEGTKPVELPDDPNATLDEIRRCTGLTVHNNRVWGYGDPENPQLIYYSQTNRYDYFDSEDLFLTMARDDNEVPVIVEPMWGGLLIGKRTGWWLLEGDPATSISIKSIVRGQGPMHRAFEVIDGELWYLAEDGVRVLTQTDLGIFVTQHASYEHTPLLHNADFSNAVFGYYDGRLVIFYKLSSDSPHNDMCSVLDLRFRELVGRRRGAWTRITGWPVSTTTHCEGGFLWAGLETGQLVRLFEGDTDLGEPIRMRLWTPEYSLGEGTRYKLFEGVSIHASQVGPGTTLLVHSEVIGPQRETHTLPLMQFRGGLQRHFSFRRRMRGLFIQHRIEATSTSEVSILAVGERWRPLRLLRAHELEGTTP